jgi:ABC-type lipoprotein export system ATPase subunit
MIEVNNISKRFKRGPREFEALVDVSLSIRKGEYVSVSGPSGSGKSTLLNIIGGLIRPDSGQVLYQGKSLYDQAGQSLHVYRKREVGFMFQQFHLMPYLTVLENIRLGCSQPSHVVPIHEYLEKCSLLDISEKYPSELSVGEKQRVAFIRAIISDPALLLADEPTGNLDPRNSKILMSLIGDFHSRGGMVLLVSHDPVAAEYADLNLKIEQGRIQ